MIDQLSYSDEGRTCTQFKVHPENIFVEAEVLSEAALVENIAQTAAARAGYIAQSENKPVLVGYIGAVTNLQVFNLPVVNDVLETEIIIENQVFDVTLISGNVKCRGNLLAQCEMKIFIIQTK